MFNEVKKNPRASAKDSLKISDILYGIFVDRFIISKTNKNEYHCLKNITGTALKKVLLFIYSAYG